MSKKESSHISSATAPDEQRRIWVGNLDPRLNEYQLLKLVQKCGPIEKFDMLFHKGGPLVGQSRGYAFVTFSTLEGAANALEKLNGSMIANRPVAVRLAKNINYDELDRPKPRLEIPALGVAKREEKLSREDAIRAIEAKLKMLERNRDDDLEFNTLDTASSSSQVPFIQRYQFNKDRDANSGNSYRGGGRGFYGGRSTTRPYNRNQRPKRR